MSSMRYKDGKFSGEIYDLSAETGVESKAKRTRNTRL
jgi:hypothetical protein